MKLEAENIFILNRGAVRKILIAGYNVFVEGYLEEANDKNINQLGKYLIQLETNK